MYLRFAIAGAAAFGVAGAVLGYAWVVSDVPFFMGLQWVAGAGVLGVMAGGSRLALKEALAAGVSFLVAFTVLLFVALAVLEFPLPIALASSAAGAVAGAVFSGAPGAWRIALAALLGFGAGEITTAGISALQPAGASQPGIVQTAWFSAAQGVAGLIGGAAVGAGFAWAVAARVRGDGRVAG